MIETRTKVMYWAPTRRRHYATLKAACLAEAGTILTKRLRSQGEHGHWIDDERSILLRSRLARMIERRFRAATKEPRP